MDRIVPRIFGWFASEMTNKRLRHAKCSLAILCAVLSGCVSNSHRPDPAAVMSSPDCDIVSGDYAVQSIPDGERLASLFYGEETAIGAISILKDESKIEVNATSADGAAMPTLFFSRYTCTDSVVRIVVNDDASSGSGAFMSTSSDAVELFALDESTLNLRIVSTVFAFLYIVPYFNSHDASVTVVRKTASEYSGLE